MELIPVDTLTPQNGPIRNFFTDFHGLQRLNVAPPEPEFAGK